MIEPDSVVELSLGAWKERANDVIFYTRVICRSHGYALTVHGTLRRDIDVVAIPWTDVAIAPEDLAVKIRDGLIKYDLAIDWAECSRDAKAEVKPFGRLGYSISLKGQPYTYLDLSVMPRKHGRYR